MTYKRIQSLTVPVLEGGAVIALVLIFFLAFLGMLNAFFPSGSSLHSMMGQEGFLSPAKLVRQSVRNLLLLKGEEEASLHSPGLHAAVLKKTRNDVNTKRANAINWEKAHSEIPLYNRDAVQTFQNASAVIEFDSLNYLSMGENTLLIIKKIERDLLSNQRRSFLVMVDGELKGRIEESEEGSVFLQVATPTAVARIRSGEGQEGETEFKVTLNSDQSSTFAVYRGEAEVLAQGGMVEVKANQSTTVAPDQAPSAIEFLPTPIELHSPSTAAIFYYRDLVPRIEFRWESRKDLNGYHFVLASDPWFETLLVDEQLSRSSFTHGNLKKGEYYWQVSGIRKKGEGVFSETRKIELVQDNQAPMLEIQFPSEAVNQPRFLLKGVTQPGALVFVGGTPVSTSSSGEFEWELQLKHGTNVVVVEAVDEAGNVTYQSNYIQGKF